MQELGQESGLAGMLAEHPYDRLDTSAVSGTMSEGNLSERCGCKEVFLLRSPSLHGR